MAPPAAPLDSAPLTVRAARAYLRLLQSSPILTKSVSSAIISALADLSAQTILRNKRFNLSSAGNYALMGLVITGPATHHFHRLLDRWLPPTLPAAAFLRLAADRLLFGPVFLLVTLYVLNRLEGHCHDSTVFMLKNGFLPMFKANLKFWVPLSYINVNYVSQEYRVLFGNVCAFFWIIIMASKRRRAALREAARRDREEEE
ncbi:peroxisomal membrane protein 2-like [Amphibalanus amphitrite]|uniref:peroxisomal membrane protein 2-like n=1 Tax=Amphibalanus amphitrite TaxID=1232801 RepID=UPI001C914FF0|nr:peroxisomal membrane protein 2-like [Amphibalanus amphitrite]